MIIRIAFHKIIKKNQCVHYSVGSIGTKCITFSKKKIKYPLFGVSVKLGFIVYTIMIENL